MTGTPTVARRRLAFSTSGEPAGVAADGQDGAVGPAADRQGVGHGQDRRGVDDHDVEALAGLGEQLAQAVAVEQPRRVDLGRPRRHEVEPAGAADDGDRLVGQALAAEDVDQAAACRGRRASGSGSGCGGRRRSSRVRRPALTHRSASWAASVVFPSEPTGAGDQDARGGRGPRRRGPSRARRGGGRGSGRTGRAAAGPGTRRAPENRPSCGRTCGSGGTTPTTGTRDRDVSSSGSTTRPACSSSRTIRPSTPKSIATGATP